MTQKQHSFSWLVLAAAVLIGCEESHDTTSRKLTVPEDAKMVAEGPGELSFQVTEDGRLFIFDDEDQAVITTRRVRAGQEFVLSPDSNTGTLDGRQVIKQDLKKKHSHKLYFAPE